MKILVSAWLPNILALGYHVKSITIVIQSYIQRNTTIKFFWDINIPASRGQNYRFLGFCQYFGLDMVYFVVISLHMMWYNTQTPKNYVIKDRKQESREKRKWYRFWKPYDNCSQSFWEKIADIFLKKAHPDILSCMSKFLHEEGLKIIK